MYKHIILFASFLLSSFLAFTQVKLDSKNFTYNNDIFHINLPINWSIDENIGEPYFFAVYSPTVTGKEQILPNISIEPKKIDSLLTINSATDFAEIAKTFMPLADTEFKLIESIKTENNSHTLIYLSALDDEGTKIKIKKYDTYFLKERTAYLVSFMASPMDYDKKIALAKKAIFSFGFN